jgi:hypothetical protein
VDLTATPVVIGPGAAAWVGGARGSGAVALIGDGPLWVFLIVGVALVGGSALFRYARQRRKNEDLQRLLERDPRLQRTVIPCGLRPDQLAWWCRGLPDGERNVGLEYGVEGRLVVDLGAGLPRETTVAAFRWWYEEEQRATRNQRTGLRGMGVGPRGQGPVRYSKRHLPAALVKLPVAMDRRVMVRPESAFGRAGLTRGGQQFESSEFNRRFRVESNDEQLSLTLLDARFQQLLVEEFPGRTIELFGELLLVAGKPSHRDESLTGVVGELPAMRQDAHRILQAIPPAFWRRLREGGTA